MKKLFFQSYQDLNLNQKKAVDTIDGPVMVLAGPGTGKTQILTLRIANILKKTDTKPESILALTFTKAAAFNMRERLLKMIGPQAYQVNINTFHGFCAQLMQEYSGFYREEVGGDPLSDLEKWQIFFDIFEKNEFQYITSFGQKFYSLQEIISSISQLKRENISPNQFKKILEKEKKEIEKFSVIGKKNKPIKTLIKKKKSLEKNLEKNKELLLVYRQYQNELKKSGRYDYDDMIIFTLNALQKEDGFLLDLQEQYLYFLVDEYQDTNDAQNNLIFLLASYWGEKANLFVVGDPNQAVYRFQGASLENTLHFLEKFPHSQVFNLDIGYRCGNHIYQKSFNLIKNNNQDEIKKYVPLSALEHAKKDFKGEIRFLQTKNFSEQYLTLVDEIKKIIKSGYSYGDIAILYRKNAEGDELLEILEKYQLPTFIEGGINVLEVKFIKQFIDLLKAINNLNLKKDDSFLELCYFDWIKAPSLEILKICRCASANQKFLVDLILQDYQSLKDLKQAESISLEDWQKAHDFIDKIINLKAKSSNLNLTAFLQLVINEFDFLNYLSNDDNRYYNLSVLKFFFNEIKKFNYKDKNLSLKKLLKIFDLMQQVDAKLTMVNPDFEDNKITLTTAHKAKGKEWRFVFVINFFNKRWGNSVNHKKIKLPSLLKFEKITKAEKNEDERRLFYVALTRTKNRATIIFPEGEDFDLDGQSKVVSMFKHELVDDKIIDKKICFNEKDLVDFYQTSLQKDKKKIKFETKKYFQYLLKNWKLSPTSLNNYLDSNKKFLENSLLNFPKLKSKSLVLGTAVHSALETMYQPILKGGQSAQFNQIWMSFMKSLQGELISGVEFKKIKKRGGEILKSYYENFHDKTINALGLEYAFGNNYKLIFADWALKGKIDRFDYVNKKNKEIMVIDYKTGRPKSPKEVLIGNKQRWSEREKDLPEGIRGAYKRQVLFYKLLSDLDKSFPYQTVIGRLDFVEVNDYGKYNFIDIEFNDEDMRDFKNLLKDVIAEIRELKFLENLEE